ncbi:MAG: TIGR04255 family protein [Mycobacteriales bacterium]
MPKFSLTPVEEVHLHEAPLEKVLMQVQYSRTPQLVTDSAEAAIAEALGRYPVRRRQVAAAAVPNVVINGQQLQLPGGVVPGVVLTFSDPKNIWQVMVTETAVSLQTSEYSTRDDFCERSAEIFDALSSVALPPVVDRVGLRYVDRLSGDSLSRVPDFVIPELRALVGCIEPPMSIVHSLTQTQIVVGENEVLQVRTGMLPAGLAFDPAVPPLAEPSWLLDMDIYTTIAGFAFDSKELAQRLRRFAETAYVFFRWATTDAFQEAHRGQPAPIAGEAR